VIRNEAMDFAEEFGKKSILDYMAESGFLPEQVTVSVEKKDIKIHAGEIPAETKFIFEGIVNYNVYEKALSGQDKSDKGFRELTELNSPLDCTLDCTSNLGC
jgi:hypothetical protein